MVGKVRGSSSEKKMISSTVRIGRPNTEQRRISRWRARQARELQPGRLERVRLQGLHGSPPASGVPGSGVSEATWIRRLDRQISALQRADDAAVAEHQGAMADVRDLLEIGRDQDHGEAARDRIRQQAIDLGLGTDVDAGGRIFQGQDAAADPQPARQHHLLLIAAGEGLDRCCRIVRLQGDPCAQANGLLGLVGRRPPDERAAAGSTGVEEHVLAHRQPERDRIGVAVARDKADAVPDRIMRARDVEPLAARLIAPRSSGSRPYSSRPTASWPAPRRPARPTISPASIARSSGPTPPAMTPSKRSSASLACRAGRTNTASGGRPMISRTRSPGAVRAVSWTATRRPSRSTARRSAIA